MSRCILFGHRPVTQPCVGKYAGSEVTVCTECGVLTDEAGNSLGVAMNVKTLQRIGDALRRPIVIVDKFP